MPLFNANVRLLPSAFEDGMQPTSAQRVQNALEKQAGIGLVTVVADKTMMGVQNFAVEIEQSDSGIRLDELAQARLSSLMRQIVQTALYPALK